MSAEIAVDEALDGIRDLLEAEQWPPDSGRAMCAVFLHYPEMELPGQFMDVVATANPGQTIAIVMESGISVSWKDFAGYSRKNDMSFQVQILRPWEAGEDKHQDFRRMYTKALNVLNRRENRQLGTTYSSIRVREWSAPDVALRTFFDVTAFGATLTAEMDNQPTLAT